MPERKSWTKDELIAAMNLYCKLPFSRLHSRTPEIIRLAEAISRTPSSVAMKLCNLASLDPAVRISGRRGLTGASAADRAVWNEFHSDWIRLAAESETLIAKILNRPSDDCSVTATSSSESQLTLVEDSQDERNPPTMPHEFFSGPTEAERSLPVRLAQRFFRQTVLASYQSRCCITGNPVPDLLVASHIIPWSTSQEHRANPRNGLCLARTHDAAFDRGLITFDEDYRLVLSKRLRGYLPDETLERNFEAYEGHLIRIPDKFPPDPMLLREHRMKTFAG